MPCVEKFITVSHRVSINDTVEIASELFWRLDILLPDKHSKIKIPQLKAPAFCLIIFENS